MLQCSQGRNVEILPQADRRWRLLDPRERAPRCSRHLRFGYPRRYVPATVRFPHSTPEPTQRQEGRLLRSSESTSLLSQHDALLGVTAVLLDRIASDYVLGPYGSKHRPRGRITLNTIEDMEQCADLNESSAYKWQQFLQVWEDAGWKRWDLLAMADELRLLLFGRPQTEELIASIDAKQMAVYSSKYSSRQEYRHIALQKALLAFVDVLQKQFSSPSAVLLPAADVFTRLSTTEVTSVKSSCMRKLTHGL